MPSTRSGRGNTASSPPQATSPAGNKRKAEASSPSSQSSKRGKKVKEQKTIEETLDPNTEATNGTTNGTHDKDETEQHNGSTNGDTGAENVSADRTYKTNGEDLKGNGDLSEQQEPQKDDPADVEMADGAQKKADQAPAKDKGKSSSAAAQEDAVNDSKPSEDTASSGAVQKDAVQEDKQREEAMPSNILEKGIIYFFTRGRVGIEEPESVQDLQRSFFVLRPLPQGGKITDGGVQDAGNNRLLALPKKVWPKSGRDRFMVFVEKAKVSMSTLKEEFFQGSDYTTQTMGDRHTPSVSPIGEGVYAITTTGGGQGTTHLAYMLTVPNELGKVQSDVGITEKGSFVLSLKNPESSGPSYASLPEKPDFPKEFVDEFRGRGWMPLHPKHLDYPNAQLLLIGEDFDSSNNLEAKPKDEQDPKKETPEEELQKLGDEEEHRVEALKGDDTIFLDLGISKKEYSGILTTW